MMKRRRMYGVALVSAFALMTLVGCKSAPEAEDDAPAEESVEASKEAKATTQAAEQGAKEKADEPLGRLDMPMERVAASERQWTGVTVSDEGRVFVNYPLWGPTPQPFAVGELKEDGSVVPYPNKALNNWDEGKPAGEHFVCVQSVVVDDSNDLWILDPANPRFEGVVEGGAKLMKVNLRTDKVEGKWTIEVPAITPQSYLNDVRIDTERQLAYMTDSGDGAIVVLDLMSGEAKRVLDDHEATEAEDVTLTIGGAPFTRRVHSDGIALSDDRQTLYFQPLTGRTLYSVPTLTLREFEDVTDKIAATSVVPVADSGASDGILWHEGKIYLTSLEHNAIRRVDPETGVIEVVAEGDAIAWPDTLAKGPDGLYFTTSLIHLGSDPGQPYGLYRVTLDAASSSPPE